MLEAVQDQPFQELVIIYITPDNLKLKPIKGKQLTLLSVSQTYCSGGAHLHTFRVAITEVTFDEGILRGVKPYGSEPAGRNAFLTWNALRSWTHLDYRQAAIPIYWRVCLIGRRAYHDTLRKIELIAILIHPTGLGILLADMGGSLSFDFV